MANNVIFRRINGHIVPIRVSEKQKNVAKGVAAGAAAVGVAHSAAKFSAGMMHDSALTELQAHAIRGARYDRMNEALKHGPLFVQAQKEQVSKMHEIERFAVKQSRKIEKSAFKVRHAGTVATAALLGYGANKILNETQLKDKPKARFAVASGASLGATFLVMRKYYRTLGGSKQLGAMALAVRRAFGG